VDSTKQSVCGKVQIFNNNLLDPILIKPRATSWVTSCWYLK